MCVNPYVTLIKINYFALALVKMADGRLPLTCGRHKSGQINI
jgi:hypothetical protein